MSETFDVVIIGAGPAGEIVGERAVKAGLSAVVVENELVGGECSYWACMPSKALLRPGEALRAVRRVPGARRAVTGEIDLAEALKRRDDMISDLLSKFPVGVVPDYLFMTRRSRKQLQDSRTATNATGAPAPFPEEAFNVPIVLTDSILITETAA